MFLREDGDWDMTIVGGGGMKDVYGGYVGST